MAYIDSANIKGTLYELQDTQARTDVGDLKSATTALETYVRDMSPVAYGNDEGIPVPIVTVRDAAPLNAENVFFEIEPLQDGSGDPSPDNVRPITGWTGAEVTRCGKNLLNAESPDYTDTLIDADGSININQNYNSWRLSAVGTFTLSVTVTERINSGRVVILNSDNNVSATIAIPLVIGLQYVTFSLSFGQYALICIRKSVTDYQLELGSTATDYEPYQGDTFDITFPSEAGTVYGGMVDLTRGKLVVDRAMVTFDGTSSTDWAYITAYGTVSRFSYNNTNILPGINNAIANYLNNGPIGTANLECINTHGSYKQFDIQILTSRLSANTVAGLMAYFGDHPLQVCYELAAPITYDLTPQEIAMFKGVNNLWANTGDISVQYRQDVYTALNNKINALEALVLENMN